MSRDNGFTLLAVIAVVVVAAIGAQRAGFQAANQSVNLTNNTTAGQLQAFTGRLVELLPLLALIAAALALLAAASDLV